MPTQTSSSASIWSIGRLDALRDVAVDGVAGVGTVDGDDADVAVFRVVDHGRTVRRPSSEGQRRGARGTGDDPPPRLVRLLMWDHAGNAQADVGHRAADVLAGSPTSAGGRSTRVARIASAGRSRPRRRVGDRRRRPRRCPRPPAPSRRTDSSGSPGCRSTGSRRSAARGRCAGGWIEAPIVRASISVATLATWWSPNATCSSTVCAGVFGSGSSVMCCA